MGVFLEFLIAMLSIFGGLGLVILLASIIVDISQGDIKFTKKFIGRSYRQHRTWHDEYYVWLSFLWIGVATERVVEYDEDCNYTHRNIQLKKAKALHFTYLQKYNPKKYNKLRSPNA